MRPSLSHSDWVIRLRLTPISAESHRPRRRTASRARLAAQQENASGSCRPPAFRLSSRVPSLPSSRTSTVVVTCASTFHVLFAFERPLTVLLASIIAVWFIFCITAIVGMTAKDMTAIIGSQAAAGVCMGISGIMYAVAGEVMPSVYRAYSQTVVNVCVLCSATSRGKGGGTDLDDALDSVASTASVIALIAMGAAMSADPLNGWRWIWRTALIMNGILLIGFTFFYFVRSLHAVPLAAPACY